MRLLAITFHRAISSDSSKGENVLLGRKLVNLDWVFVGLFCVGLFWGVDKLKIGCLGAAFLASTTPSFTMFLFFVQNLGLSLLA